MAASKYVTYIESSVFSFYFSTRTEPEMIARKNWTRKWWEIAPAEHDLVTSPAVLAELSRGDYESQADCLSLASSLPILAAEPEIADIVATYIRKQVMPADPAGDALHLAIASYHRCHFLVTWNCKHIANVHKFDHIQSVNGSLGLYTPKLITPLEILEVSADE